MPVIGKKVVQLDIRLVRGDSERVGGRWRRRDLGTGAVTPVDLHAAGWNCGARTGRNDGGSAPAAR